MTSRLNWFSTNVVCIVFVVSGIISISISAWQFQNGDGGTTWKSTQDGSTLDWSSDICNEYPYQYMRPFSILCDNCPGKSFCGYSDGNTGYRLALAILTIGFAVALYFKVFDEKPIVLYFLLLSHALFWLAAALADSVALSAASLACDSDKFALGTYGCYPQTYGISIGLDIGMIFVSTLAWFALSAFTTKGMNYGGNENVTPTRPSITAVASATVVAPAEQRKSFFSSNPSAPPVATPVTTTTVSTRDELAPSWLSE